MRKKLLLLIMIICMAAALVLLFMGERRYYYTSLLILAAGFAAAAFHYEQTEHAAAEVVLTALFCALAVVGRAAFFYTPSLKAISAVIILAGVFTGAGNGFMVGAASGFISNFIFGQGPWTPWQMLCWGLIGLAAGLLFYGRETPRWQVCLFGGLSIYLLFGSIINPASFMMMQAYADLDSIIASYVAGFPFDTLHSLSTVAFLWLLYLPVQRKMRRIGVKYGVFRRGMQVRSG